ncbi:MAG: leucine-rich repeat protein [Clostridium sp.]|jgi:hypothetical protein|nr:leucine-rich repeat protein [Clostridium sp.]
MFFVTTKERTLAFIKRWRAVIISVALLLLCGIILPVLTTRAAPADPTTLYLFDEATQSLLVYLGHETNPVIPATFPVDTDSDGNYDTDVPVKALGQQLFLNKYINSVTIPEGIETIGKQAFQGNNLSSVSFPTTIKTIGESAFAFNSLSTVTLPSSLVSMGKFAFANNQISTISAWPSHLVSIPEGAFQQNELTALPAFPETLQTIGDGAFEFNHIVSITIPNTVFSYGQHVFANNGRYVLVTTTNAYITTNIIDGQWGEIVNPLTATIKFVDYTTQTSIQSDVSYTTDTETQLVASTYMMSKGNPFIYAAPALAGYKPYGVVSTNPVGATLSGGKLYHTPTANPTYTIYYIPTDSGPQFTMAGAAITAPGLSSASFENGDTIDFDALMQNVVVTDVSDPDNVVTMPFSAVTIKVVKPTAYAGTTLNSGSGTTLDSSVAINYILEYSATGADGNTTKLQRTVTVAADILQVDIGNGWTYGDFAYNGVQLMGFSAQGLAKFNGTGAYAGAGAKRAVVFPGMNPGYTGAAGGTLTAAPANKNVVLQTLTNGFQGSATTLSGLMTTIDFSNMTGLKTINDSALRYYKGTGQVLDLSVCKNLVSINSNYAFEQFVGTDLILADMPKLTTIGNRAFNNFNGNLTFENLPSLTTISTYAFVSYKGTGTTLSFDFPKLKYIGQQAFYVFEGTGLDFTGAVNLEQIVNSAFCYYNGAQILGLNNKPKLYQIEGFFTWKGTGQVLDLSNLPSLVCVGYSSRIRYDETADLGNDGQAAFPAFVGTSIDFTGTTNIEVFGRAAFRNYNGAEIDFSQFPKLDCFGAQCFQSYNPPTLDFTQTPNLKKICYKAFYSFTGSGGALNFTPIRDTLTTLGAGAFYSYNSPAHATVAFCPDLPNVKVLGYGTNGTSFTNVANNGVFNNYNGAAGLDLHGMPNLEVITRDTFRSYKGNNGTLALDFTGNPKIKYLSGFYSYVGNAVSNPIDLSTLTVLDTIGTYAFYSFNNLLDPIDFNMCPKIKTIEDYAFYSYKGTNYALDLSPMNLLTTIGASAFYTYGNGDTSSNSRLIFPDLTHITSIGSAAFYNYQGVGSNLDLSSLINLQQNWWTAGWPGANPDESYQGYNPAYRRDTAAVPESAGPPYVPLDDANTSTATYGTMANLEDALAENVFYSFAGESLTLPESMKYINYGNFVKFTGTINLPADMRMLGSVPYLSHSVGTGRLIPTSTGYFLSWKGPLPDFDSLDKVQTISGAVFPNAVLGGDGKTLDLSGMTNLKNILWVVTNWQMNIKWKLTDTGNSHRYYWSNAGFIDNKTMFGGGTSGLPNGTEILLPDGVYNLPIQALNDGDLNQGDVYYYVYSENPDVIAQDGESALGRVPTAAQLTAGQTQSTVTLRVNWAKVVVNCYDQATGELIKTQTVYVDKDVGDSYTLTDKPIVPGKALIDPSDRTITLNDLREGNVIDLYYTDDIPVNNPNITVFALANKAQNSLGGPGTEWEIGKAMVFSLNLTNLSGVDAGTKIYIPVGPYTDTTSGKIIAAITGQTAVSNNNALPATGVLRSLVVEDGYIVITLNGGAQNVQPDISIIFKDYETPWGYDEELTAYLYAPDGTYLAQTGGAHLKGYKSGTPSVRKYMNGHSENDYEISNGEVVEENGVHYISLNSEKDVKFTYSFNTSTTYWNRNVDQIEVIDELPTYVNKDGLTVRAHFDPAKNPNWELMDDGIHVRYVFPQIAPGHTLPAGAAWPTLTLTFPLARLDAPGLMQYVTNNVELRARVAEPNNIDLNDIEVGDDGRQYFTSSDSIRFVIVATSAGSYGKNASGPHARNSNHVFFYDDEVDKAGRMTWNIAMGNRKDDGQGTYTDVWFRDFDLDERMYYYAVQFPTKNTITSGAKQTVQGSVEVIAYDAADNVIVDAFFTSSDGEYVFPAAVAQNIAYFELYMPDGYTMEPDSRMSFNVYAKLRDPESVTYSDCLSNGRTSFFNDSMAHFTTVNAQGLDTLHTHHSGDVIYIDPVTNILNIHKSPAKALNGHTIIVNGDIIEYTLSLSGERSTSSNPKNIKVIDLLPRYVELVSYETTALFNNSINAKCEVVGDYMGTGRTAIILTADRLVLDGIASGIFGTSGTSLITLQVTLAPYEVDGEVPSFLSIVNEAYLSCDNFIIGDSTKIATGHPNYLDINDAPGEQDVSYAYQEIAAMGGVAVAATKEIRAYPNGDWRTSGVKTKAGTQIEYKLLQNNPSELPLLDFTFYDIFPYVGDKLTKIENGVNPERGTEFRNTLAQPIEVPVGESWLVYYTVDPSAVNTQEWIAEDSHWILSTGVADYWDVDLNGDSVADFASEEDFIAHVTGIKVETGDLPKLSHRSINVIMNVPEDANMELINRQAWNSFNVSFANEGFEQHSFTESNKVYNQILPPEMNILAQKVGEDPASVTEPKAMIPLAGVSMGLVNLSTNKVVQVNLTDASGFVSFTNVPLGNYVIRELAALEGYTLDPAADLSVTQEDLIITGDGGTFNAGVLENYLTPPPPPTGTVKLLKHNAAGAALKNITFRVTGLDASNSYVDIIRVTQPDGYASWESLPLGNYKIEETSTNGSKLTPSYSSTFELTADGQVIELGPVINNKANFKLIKIGIFDEAIMAYANHSLTKTMGKKLPNVEFTLYENPQYPDPVSLPATPFLAAKTNVNGELELSDLTPGVHYTLVETEDAATDGYTLRTAADDVHNAYPAGQYDIYITLDGILYLDGHKVNYTDLTIGNDSVIEGFLARIKKVDQNGEPLPGVTFRVATIASGTYTTANSVSVVTDANGEIYITQDWLLSCGASELVALGDPAYKNDTAHPLYIMETAVPNGYTVPAVVPTFTAYIGAGYQVFEAVNYETKLQLFKYNTICADTEETLKFFGLTDIINRLTAAHGTGYNIYYSDLTEAEITQLNDCLNGLPYLRLYVNDITDEVQLRKGIEGVTIRVDNNSAWATDGASGFTATTDNTGMLQVPSDFKFVAGTTYYYKERQNAPGYKLDKTVRSFLPNTVKTTAGFDGNIYIDFENVLALGKITITKLSDYGGQLLEGVSFKLEKDGELIGTRTTDYRGIAIFDGLEYGTYVLTETATLSEYRLDSTPRQIIINEDNFDVKLELVNENKNKFSSLVIHKQDDSGTNLPGMEFKLQQKQADGTWLDYDAEDALGAYGTRTTNGSGIAYFGNIAGGTYRIVEKATEAYNAPTYLFSDEPAGTEPHYSGEFTVNPSISKTFTVDCVNPVAAAVKITKKIQKADFINAHGDISFMFRVSSLEGDGGVPSLWGGNDWANDWDRKLDYYTEISFDAATVAALTPDADGWITLSKYIYNLPPGVYSVQEMDTNRYELSSHAIGDDTNGTALTDASGNKLVNIVLTKEHATGEAVFKNAKVDDGGDSDSKLITNTIGGWDSGENKGITTALPKIRYIRDTINGSSASTANTWYEVQAIDSTGVNRLAGKIPTLSTGFTWHSSYPAARATDGNTTSYAQTGQAGKATITYDLGALYEIEYIIIWHYNVSNGRTFRDTLTEVSADGVNWVTIWDITHVETSSGLILYLPDVYNP